MCFCYYCRRLAVLVAVIINISVTDAIHFYALITCGQHANVTASETRLWRVWNIDLFDVPLECRAVAYNSDVDNGVSDRRIAAASVVRACMFYYL